MGLILMILTVLGLIAAVFVIIVASIKHARFLGKFIFGAVVIWFALYFGLLVITSLRSKEKLLAVNEPKEFCGFYLDCHMHAAVAGVRQTKTIGEGANQKTAQGTFYVVTVKVFSDAKAATIGLLTPRARVVDVSGKTFERAAEAEKALETVTGKTITFDKRVGPQGDYFTKEIVFDLPQDTKNPKLDLTQGYAIDRFLETFLIGDEDSMFHKPVRFSLEQPKTNAGVQ